MSNLMLDLEQDAEDVEKILKPYFDKTDEESGYICALYKGGRMAKMACCNPMSLTEMIAGILETVEHENPGVAARLLTGIAWAMKSRGLNLYDQFEEIIKELREEESGEDNEEKENPKAD